MKLLQFTKTAIGNLFAKPVTRSYPFVPRKYPERTRGQIGIEIEVCIFCGICARKCPTGAITVKRADKSWAIERFGCIQCGYCVQVCPKNCLIMLQDYTEPSQGKTIDVVVAPPPVEKPEVKAEPAAVAGKHERDQSGN